MDADKSQLLVSSADRFDAAWHRFVDFVIRMAKRRRLWNNLGLYLQMIRQRGRQALEP